MSEYLQHIASDGERWDTLSYQYYGNAEKYSLIIAANSHLQIKPTLTAGQVVLIPIIEPVPDPQPLPPWLRS